MKEGRPEKTGRPIHTDCSVKTPNDLLLYCYLLGLGPLTKVLLAVYCLVGTYFNCVFLAALEFLYLE